ncbi:MAG: type IV pilin protein [Pseudomonadota bacterium]
MTRPNPTARGSKGLAISGFTLIELMVVIAIIGVLVTIGLPSYTGYIQRGERAAARAAVLEAQQFMERYYAANNTFVGAVLPARFTNVPAGSPKYTIGLLPVAAHTANTFTLTADPINTVVKCDNLTLTHTGVKGVSYPAAPTPADIAECWR